MTRVERSVEIERPVEEVYAFVSDPRNDPRWCPKVLSCEPVEDTAPAAARFQVIHRPTRMKPSLPLELEVRELEPPRRVRLHEEDGDGVFDVTYELEPTSRGTRFTQVSEIEWKLSKPARWIADRLVPRHLEEQMAELKRVLEAGT